VLAAVCAPQEVRRREVELAEQTEQAYRRLVADWQAKGPNNEIGVAANGGRLLGDALAAKHD
jgi:hypothetical protein